MYEEIRQYIRNVPDFPQKGIMFKDITPALNNGQCLQHIVDMFYNRFKGVKIDKIAAIESRGFLLGAPLAYKLGCGITLLRKPGKLPAEKIKEYYNLEYGSAALEIHTDSIKNGDNVLIIDDLLATGGTAEAACKLLKRLHAQISAITFLIELTQLSGAEKLAPYGEVVSFLKY